MADISWVTSQVALGSEPSASWVPQMIAAGITDVLDLRGEPRANDQPEPELYAGTPITYHYLPMLDRGTPEPASAYVEGVGIIDQVVANGGKILVHCSAGISRSPSMVYAYLRSTGMSAGDAWNMIQNARSVASQQYFGSADAALPAIAASPPPTMPATSGGAGPVLVIGGALLLAGWLLFRETPHKRFAT